jgi:hypothetical protein
MAFGWWYVTFVGMVELKKLEFIEFRGCQPGVHHAGYVQVARRDTAALNRALMGGDDVSGEFKIINDDLGVAAILGGEKEDDLAKDGVREVADAVRPRFFGFLQSRGLTLATSLHATGCGIYNRHRRWHEPCLLGARASRLHFPCGCRMELMDLSKVENDKPSCSAGEEEGELVFFVGVRKKGS